MAPRRDGPVADTVRMTRWRESMIEAIGESMRDCVRRLHAPRLTTRGLVIDALRHCHVPELMLQGVMLYWDRLTVEGQATK